MILEAIVTTKNVDGTINTSPMGPVMGKDMERFQLRPFETSTTYANLKRTRQGVMHVTDDVLLFAESAIGRPRTPVEYVDAGKVDGKVIATACRAFEFEVEFMDETGPRIDLNCRTLKVHRLRDFFGFNRGKHAVLEAAILATRVDFIPIEVIKESYQRLKVIVEKTGGDSEIAAFGLLHTYVFGAATKSVES